MSVEEIVKDRYSEAAKMYEPGLCCPPIYDAKFLKLIPEEILEKDYGCGDPSPYLKEGETVLDLGSGGGKLCFIASQIVGESGRVIGIDINDDMLELAARGKKEFAQSVGYDNCEFVKGNIEDMRTDVVLIDEFLADNAVNSFQQLTSLDELLEDQKNRTPLIADNSIDVIVSNCVLNLISEKQRRQLFSEIHRVLKPGGRAVISDVVSDEPLPVHLKDDPDLWGACYSGAMLEQDFVDAFIDCGMCGLEILKRDEQPYHKLEGIELRNVTVVSYKREPGADLDCKQAVIYKGPFSHVEDDDNHIFPRGTRVSVSDKTFRALSNEPYSEVFEFIEPAVAVSVDKASTFECSSESKFAVMNPREQKSTDTTTSKEPESCCAPSAGSSSCC